jgi:Fe-S cluster assembly scaffold protein SufB
LKLSEAKLRARELLEKLEWQYVGDSPTTRYYTDWSSFEALLEGGASTKWVKPDLGGLDYIVGCGGGGRDSVLGLAKPEESKLIAAHYAFLDTVDYVAVGPGRSLVAGLCGSEPGRWGSQHIVVKLDGGSLLVVGRRGGGSLVLEVEASGASTLGLIVSSDSPLAVLDRASVADGSRLAISLLSSHASSARAEVTVTLGERSTVTLTSYSVARRGVADVLLNAVHGGSYSKSSIRGFGVALDSATMVVRGISRVSSQALQAATRVELEALALGDGSKAYTAPFLEVDTGEVIEASHSAASYRIGSHQLFYLQSRGLSEDDAIELILEERLAAVVKPLEPLLAKLSWSPRMLLAADEVDAIG